ncbi:MAG: holo-ACP synthase [Proteobacteria bacterium]|nr:holo-ACP synthase [Pseudomonadota bacterium]
MIIGIGTDICHTSRIKVSTHFAERILTSAEIVLFNAIKDNQKQNFLAKRFSAKESISKAFGFGIGGAIGFQDIEITSDTKGKPVVEISTQAKEKLPTFSSVHLSISDEKEYVVTFAVVEND